MTTPTWQQLHATKTGDHPALIGTRAQIRNCSHCGLIVLAGYDSHLMANLAITDPYLLTPQLEAAAVILAIRTYHARGITGRYELTNRHTPGITRPAWVTYPPANQVPVVAAHRCGIPALSRQPLPLAAPATSWGKGDPPF